MAEVCIKLCWKTFSIYEGCLGKSVDKRVQWLGLWEPNTVLYVCMYVCMYIFTQVKVQSLNFFHLTARGNGQENNFEWC